LSLKNFTVPVFRSLAMTLLPLLLGVERNRPAGVSRRAGQHGPAGLGG
jgi:hypothetical protein